MFIIQVSWDTELFESIKFYLEDGLEMAIMSDTWEDIAHLLFRLPGRQSSLSQ